VTSECIHGLELSRCDVCSPKAVAVRDAAPARVARTRTTRPSTSGTRTAGTRVPAKRPVNVGEQRIHHVTHLSNLAGILNRGALLADANDGWDARPAVDVSSIDNRTLRRSTAVTAGASVAEYVPFYLSPDAYLWEAIRAGASDPRLSSGAAALPASEFVVLVSTVKAATHTLTAPDAVAVSDRDAADPRARLATATDEYELLLRRLITDSEHDAVRYAEFLVKDSVPLESFSLVGVAHDKARLAVRAILESTGFRPRVAVHPPWFAVPAEG
jgi:hypothetical protein